MKSIKYILFIFLITVVHSAIAFESIEHDLLGSNIHIIIPNTSAHDYSDNNFTLGKNTYKYRTNQPTNIFYFYLPNENGTPDLNNSLTYGEFNALAGDLYADPDEPVSLGKDLSERTQRAVDYVYTLLYSPNAIKTAIPLALKIRQDSELVARQLKDNITVNPNKLIMQKTKEESSLATKELGTVYLLHLMLFNFDHHHNTALFARRAVHNLAMQVDKKAHNKSSGSFLVEGIKHTIIVPYGINGLIIAYEINAMGNHFLEDSFAAGHAANLRYQVTQYDKLAFPFNSMLMQFQYDEDNKFGVKLHSNEHIKGWSAYGDGKLFDPGNKQSLKYIEEALQLSVEQVYKAYTKGIISPVGKTSISNLEPNMLLAEGIKTPGDMPSIDVREHIYRNGTVDYAAPMFYANTINKTVYARDNLRQTESARRGYNYHPLNITNMAIVWACASHFAGGFKPGSAENKFTSLISQNMINVSNKYELRNNDLVKHILDNHGKNISLLVKRVYLLNGQSFNPKNVVDNLCDRWWWF